MSTQRWPFTGVVRRVDTWRHLRLPRSVIGQRNQRQIAFSISLTRQEPRGLVGSSVISDPVVPGSKFHRGQLFISVSLFFPQSEDSEKFQSLSHVRQWPPHMRTSEVNKKPPSRLLIIGFKNPRQVIIGIYKPLAKVCAQMGAWQ